ncbi:protein kinase [Myxococcus llanfairpwllgwyngyllgogerychwyrndrobwllllantysiliogogogochensis]|uniref:Protein kinase n=1 Tax=Myxococcus llanfairpwllgwyngyllgogerychwyrndrobwllllantysiliogogogochensis TaxID=2590453 RepID=A0A540WWW9_9BACT|nr:protein kinase [Myxococcus llanfairpwllgwyngyllgogerychwyrndrobwllllantysiliogogogochensis]TQF13440.1 protein kinase [Myxococcus llanfairpwllgwyngyllgogerychwyrndrobwllllantysiliogogogochensis]
MSQESKAVAEEVDEEVVDLDLHGGEDLVSDDEILAAGPPPPFPSIGAAPVSPPLTQLTAEATRYSIICRLGQGGMAEVYKGEMVGALGIKRLVAIKRILPENAADQEWRKMFFEEARVATLLRHRNIISAFQLQEGDDSSLMLVMDYVDGVELRGLLRMAELKGTRLSVPFACYVAAEVADALHYAHRITVDGRPIELVHRDVSSSNVMITRTGDVKLLDFGIAKTNFEDREKTSAGTFKGKFAYIAPEQLIGGGKRVDGRADQWALAVVLGEMLTGSRIFAGDSDYETIQRVTGASPAYIRGRLEGLHPTLVDILLKSLSLELNDRFPTCAAFGNVLRRFVATSGTVFGANEAAGELEELESVQPAPSSEGPGKKVDPTKIARASKSASSFSLPPLVVPSTVGSLDASSTPSAPEVAVAGERPRRRRTVVFAAAAVLAVTVTALGALFVSGQRHAGGETSGVGTLPALDVGAIAGRGVLPAPERLESPAPGPSPVEAVAASGAMADGQPAAPVLPLQGEPRVVKPEGAVAAAATKEQPPPEGAPAKHGASTGGERPPAQQKADGKSPPTDGKSPPAEKLPGRVADASVPPLVEAPPPAKVAEPPAKVVASGMGIAGGTLIPACTTSHADPNAPGDFTAEVSENVEAGGAVVIPRGTELTCSVTGGEGTRVVAKCGALALVSGPKSFDGFAVDRKDRRPGIRGPLPDSLVRIPKGSCFLAHVRVAF